MFTLRQMTYFDALLRTGHFGRAAEMVHVSQPALSVQIAEMEKLAGGQLIERHRGGVILTPLGAKLLPLMRSILDRSEALTELIKQGNGTFSGVFRLGMIPTIAPYLLPSIIPRLQKSHRDLDLKVREAMTETLVGELHSGALDAIVAAAPISDDGLRQIALFDDPFYVASASNTTDILASPMAQDAVDIDRLLLLDEGHCLRDQALEVCAVAKERRLVNFGATSMTTLLQMVSNGMGLTLLPAIAVDAETKAARGLSLTPFADPAPSRKIALFHRATSYRSEELNALAAVLKDAAQPLLDRAAAKLTT